MRSWTESELESIGRADELRVASRRADDTIRPYVTIWTTREGDDIYVRSARGVEKDVIFTREEDAATNARVDAAMHAKYDRYGPGPVGTITGSDSHATTLRVMPEA